MSKRSYSCGMAVLFALVSVEAEANGALLRRGIDAMGDATARAESRALANQAARTAERAVVRQEAKTVAQPLTTQSVMSSATQGAARARAADDSWNAALQTHARGMENRELQRRLNELSKAKTPAPTTLTRQFDNVNNPGVVYQRFNPASGASYVGRSKSGGQSYINRQNAHDARHGVDHSYRIVAVTKDPANLRVAEESAMRMAGGKGKLANKRVEMKDETYRRKGGFVPLP